MTRAFSIASLLRRKSSAAAAVREHAQGRTTGSSHPDAQATQSRRVFDKKPPEPTPALPLRVFGSAPRLRERI